MICLPDIILEKNLSILLPKLINKLSDSKIAIRQASSKNIKDLFKVANIFSNLKYFFFIKNLKVAKNIKKSFWMT